MLPPVRRCSPFGQFGRGGFIEDEVIGVKIGSRIIPFKYKLGALLFAVVLLMASFLGAFQYFLVKEMLEDNFSQSRQLIKDRVANIVRDADYMNLLVEKPLEQQATVLLEQVRAEYERRGNLDFPLQAFVEGGGGNTHLYIINKSNTVEASTDLEDLGLNFSAWPGFVQFLAEVRQNQVFMPSRISLSLNGAEMTKYCYLSSRDGKYIFETGMRINQGGQTAGISFDNFEEPIIRDNSFIDRIILYDYEGVSYKKNGQGMNMKIEPDRLGYFTQALESLEPVEAAASYNGHSVIYQYVPYEIIGARGANERNVAEIIYNDLAVKDRLANNMKIAVAVGLLAALLAGSFGLYKASSITSPIGQLTVAIDQVSRGDFDIDLRIQSKDELALLGDQLTSMAHHIKSLLAERYGREAELAAKNTEILQQKEQITSLYKELEILLQENQNSYFETVRALANAIEAKDSYTGGHCERVMEYSLGIANKMGLGEQELSDLRFGSILHDIGKIGIPEPVLNNKGSFTQEEYELMKKHPEIGDTILKELNFLSKSRKIVYEHHERVDGKGYPNGLAGDQIDLLAKIVGAADAYDAMTSKRPYRREAMSKEAAIAELLHHRGTQFDGGIVDAFINWLNEQPQGLPPAG